MTVDSIVRHWISIIVENESVIHDRLGVAVGRFIGVFYVDDIVTGLRVPDWFQGEINLLHGMFRWVGLMSNITNSNTMTFQLWDLFTRIP